MSILKWLFGSKNDRELKKIGKVVAQIATFEPKLQQLSDDQLRAKTAEFKDRLADRKSTRLNSSH